MTNLVLVNLLFRKKCIRLLNTKVHNGNVLVTKLSYPKSMKKYFSSDCIYAEYNRRIDCVDESILNIPAIAILVPLAWAIGANLSVKKLDKSFLESLNKIRPIMQKWHPNFSFSTEIKVEEVVSNKFSNKGCALLFSGGLDSTVSYIRNKDKKPQLISIRGLDVLTEKRQVWTNVAEQLTAFAKRENIKIHFIKTNARELFFESLLSIEFGRSWYVRVSHGLLTLGLCAPLTGEGFGTLLIASSRGPQHPNEVRYPLGSSPLIDEKISWADVKIIHDSYDLNRSQKIMKVLRNHVESGNTIFLRVCVNPVKDLNCSKCSKCIATITGLAVAGIDPNKCGFKMSSQTWVDLKQSFMSHKKQLFENDLITPHFSYRTDDWKEMQKEISRDDIPNMHNSKYFFEWFRDYDLVKYGLEMEKRMEITRLLKVLKYRLLGVMLTFFYFLPKRQQEVLKQLFPVMDY